MRRRASWTAGAAIVCCAGIVPPARAANRYSHGLHHATVVSVDGPGLLTIQAGSRTLPIRLGGIDVPNAATPTTPAECGAAQSTDALRRIVTKRHGVFYTLLRSTGADPARPAVSLPVRDTAGRFVVRLTTALPAPYVQAPSVAARLAAAGWARWGFGTDGTKVDIAGTADAAETVAEATDGDQPDGGQATVDAAAWAGRGVWGLCGGRMHLPADVPAAPYVPATWSISSAGIIQGIGPLAASLPTSKSSAPTTLAAVRPLFPNSELVTSEGVCLLVAPAAGVMFWAFSSKQSLDCDASYLVLATTLRPGVPTSLAVRTGDSVAAFRAAYPHARNNDDGGLRHGQLFFGSPVAPGTAASDDISPVGLVAGMIDGHSRVTTFYAGFVDLSPS